MSEPERLKANRANWDEPVPWRMFKCLVQGTDGLYRWPDKPWLPLAYSLSAERL